MGLSNAASRARNYTASVNQNQGGGSKKAGFPFIIGRTANITRQLDCTNAKNNNCCGLPIYQKTLVLANISRNTGRNSNVDYWKVPNLSK